MNEGGVYAVTIHDRYDESSTTTFDPALVDQAAPSCDCLDGLRDGAIFHAWAQNAVGAGSCDVVSGSASGLPGARIVGTPARYPSATNLGSSGTARAFFSLYWETIETGSGRGGTGGAHFLATGPFGKVDVFSPPAPGTVPPLLLTRYFFPEGATLGCADTFVVSLREIPFSTKPPEPVLGPATCGTDDARDNLSRISKRVRRVTFHYHPDGLRSNQAMRGCALVPF